MSQDFEVPFKYLFVPTSRSRMSNIFRALEFLGKSNGKKWSKNIKKKKKVKRVLNCRTKKTIFLANLSLINHYSLCQSSQEFYGIGATIRIVQEIQCLPCVGLFSLEK